MDFNFGDCREEKPQDKARRYGDPDMLLRVGIKVFDQLCGSKADIGCDNYR